MTPVRLEPAALRSRVKHSTTEPLRSLELMDKEFYAQNICLTGPMTLIILFPSSERVEEQNLFFSKFDFMLWNKLHVFY